MIYLIYDIFDGGNHHFNTQLTKIYFNSNNNIDSLTYFQKLNQQDGLDYYMKMFKDDKYINNVTNTELYKLEVYIHSGFNYVFTLLSVDETKLEEIVLQQKQFDKFFILACRNNFWYRCYKELELKYESFDWIINEIVNQTYFNDKMIDQPAEIKIKLYNYQKRTIQWMIDTEKNKEENQNQLYYSYHSLFRMNDQYYYDPVLKDIKNKHYLNKIKFHGGCLIDDVGLGKTIQMITMSLLNKPKQMSYVQKDDKYHLYSRATLILSPSQICNQWELEMNRMIDGKNKLNVIIMTTKHQFKKYTYQQILDTDYIIVSFNLFENECLLKECFPVYTKNTIKRINSDELCNEIELYGQTLVDNVFDYIDRSNVNIFTIHWNRIIVDEFHEIYTVEKYHNLQNFLPLFQASYKWCMSGTPFNKSSSCLYYMFNFITDQHISFDQFKILMKSKQIQNYIIHNMFRRHTKELAEIDSIFPKISEEVIWLKFTSTEMMIYNAYLANRNNQVDSVFLRKLCCHPQLAEEIKSQLDNCKTLDDIEQKMLSYYQEQMKLSLQKLEKHTKILENSLERIKEYEEKRKKKNNNTELVEITNYLQQEYQQRDKKIEDVKEYKRIYEGNKTTFEFYSNVIEKLRKKSDESNVEGSSEDLTCSICLEDSDPNLIGVTICGHIYCYECILQAVRTTGKCAYCRKALQIQDIHKVSLEKKQNELNQSQSLINTYGTKLANLIHYLNTNKDKNVILFSQWHDLLKMVGDVLQKNNIKNVFCQGNIYCMNKAIHEFNTSDDVRVIMLSSSNAASGVNLTKASIVILLDPVYGDYEYRKNTEGQAIGRAYRFGQKNNVKIVRFMIRNTIEEEIYNTNVKYDKAHNRSIIPIFERLEYDIN
jgi:SNF2 family DNA or RNA helicase